VDWLWTRARHQIFFRDGRPNCADSHRGGAASYASSLAPPSCITRIIVARRLPCRLAQDTVRTVKIHETIHGRAYVFEVVSVTPDRWRAQIARRGATTALMPFYGATPVEAARHLAGWLTRAGQKSAGVADPVQKVDARPQVRSVKPEV
jgi:hypothetical protein